MSNAIQHWLQLTWPLRYLSLLAAAFGLFFIAWWMLLQPQRRVTHEARLQLAQQQQRVQQRQFQLAQHPDIATLQAQLVLETARQPVAPRTLEAIIAERGAQLTQWLTDEEPRVLTFHLQWVQFQPLFSALSQSATAFPGRFQLTAHPAHLVAQLWLQSDEAR
ncbi:HofO family protein [Pantoea ananatis]|uniref:HofO family protein n=1 Tax=Pantoea ananas TaxID=553 RepID=UPI000B7D0789|nr:hypothetical protein [Pantoea ananatis]AWQ20936.1 hypothetical protein C1N63_20000 [Pantoea ananatis]MBN6032384.1 hypothetical protein [Pantoea ananatis]MCK0555450.1 hypothetical protein [Pantoea ananatis]MCW0308254.1 hypothetical protein [Pantoea ananatis]MCW0340481.1 hypothetical protein [Pantoea ananatis]